MHIAYYPTRLTRQTPLDTVDRINALVDGKGVLSVDVVDENGEVAAVSLCKDGCEIVVSGRDPKNLYRKLYSPIGIKFLVIAVHPDSLMLPTKTA